MLVRWSRGRQPNPHRATECLAMLRARKPEAVTKRLKLFMFGPAGVGKTTAQEWKPPLYGNGCLTGYSAECYALRGTWRDAPAHPDGWRERPYDTQQPAASRDYSLTRCQLRQGAKLSER